MSAEFSIAADARIRLRAALLSLVVATLMLGAKYQAYRMTGSTAVLSDALESIVNVLAAVFALGGEFFSAAFEGGLIAFASILIVYEAVRSLVAGPDVRQIGVGLLIVLGSALVNLALGLYLVRTGRRYVSLTLIADGQHVLADVWTSVGIIVGLGLVHLTGQAWLDPVVALLVALWLMVTGFGLVRHAAGGLLDEEDPLLLKQVLGALQKYVGGGVIRVHHLRAIRSGRFQHVEAHLVVPEFWSVERAHDLSEDVATRVMRDLGAEGEMVFHTDPCHRIYCAMCDLEDCPIRREPFIKQTPLTLEEAVQPDMPRSSARA